MFVCLHAVGIAAPSMTCTIPAEAQCLHSLDHVNLAQLTALEIRFRRPARIQYDAKKRVRCTRRCKRDCAVMTLAEGSSGACIFWALFFFTSSLSLRIFHSNTRTNPWLEARTKCSFIQFVSFHERCRSCRLEPQDLGPFSGALQTVIGCEPSADDTP